MSPEAEVVEGKQAEDRAKERLARLDARAQFLRLLKKNGIPVDDVAAQMFLENNMYVDFFEVVNGKTTATLTQGGQIALQGMISQRPSAVRTYEDTRAQLGFEPAIPVEEGRESEAVRYRFQTPATTPGGMRSQLNQETGGKLYENGVMVNTHDGTIVWPSDPSVVGSPAWMDGVAGWSEAKIIAEKKRLQDAGYYQPPNDKIDGRYSDGFISALQTYHNNRYVYGNGRPVASEQGGQDTSGFETQDLGQLRASIRNQVREQYLTVYGAEPTDAELAHWTNFIVATGNKLQKGGKGLTPSEAMGEATAGMVEQTATDPEAKKLAEYTNENTSLRDALANAVQVSKQAFL